MLIMPFYSREEQIDKLIIYGECKRNSRSVARLYAERYPDRHVPSVPYFPYLENCLKHGDNADIHNGTYIISEETEINVLAYIQYDCTASLREIALQDLQILGCLTAKTTDIGPPQTNA